MSDQSAVDRSDSSGNIQLPDSAIRNNNNNNKGILPASTANNTKLDTSSQQYPKAEKDEDKNSSSSNNNGNISPSSNTSNSSTSTSTRKVSTVTIATLLDDDASDNENDFDDLDTDNDSNDNNNNDNNTSNNNDSNNNNINNNNNNNSNSNDSRNNEESDMVEALVPSAVGGDGVDISGSPVKAKVSIAGKDASMMIPGEPRSSQEADESKEKSSSSGSSKESSSEQPSSSSPATTLTAGSDDDNDDARFVPLKLKVIPPPRGSKVTGLPLTTRSQSAVSPREALMRNKWQSAVENMGGEKGSDMFLTRAEGHGRSASEPADLLSMSDGTMSPMVGSPFEQALVAQAALKRKKKKKQLALAPRRRYIRKRKKGEITREHEQYNLTYSMMLGIRYSVAKQPYRMHVGVDGQMGMKRHDLVIDDFMHVDKVLFKPEGGQQGSDPTTMTPAHRLQGAFKFKDYAPEVFRQLRNSYGINDVDYMLSLCGNFNFIEFISNSKSGQFFFYSNDGRYLIKTQSSAESKFLRRILPQYYMYMVENPNSLIVRFCGMHRVKVPHIRRRMHFVIMCSVFSDENSRKIHHVYDLKGSTVGRESKPDETVKKDVDILKVGQRVRLGSQRDIFMDQLESDANFLKSLKIMDYSLLVGIHDKNKPGHVYEESASSMTLLLQHEEEQRQQQQQLATATTFVKDEEADTTKSAKATADAAAQGPAAVVTTQEKRKSVAGGGASGGGGVSVATGHHHHSHSHAHPPPTPTYSVRLSPRPMLKKGYDPIPKFAGEAGETQGIRKNSGAAAGSNRRARSWSEGAADKEARTRRKSSILDSQHGTEGLMSGVVFRDAGEDGVFVRDHGPMRTTNNPMMKQGAAASGKMARAGGLVISNLSELRSSRDDEGDEEDGESWASDDDYSDDDDDDRNNSSLFALIHSQDETGKRGNEVYYMGIIDILQQYNTRKRFEHTFKSLVEDGKQISAVHPNSYASRFVKFVNNLVT